MFKTADTGTLKQDKKCQPCWYIILSTMSGSTTLRISPKVWIYFFVIFIIVMHIEKSNSVYNICTMMLFKI
jgi:hypothetical protein